MDEPSKYKFNHTLMFHSSPSQMQVLAIFSCSVGQVDILRTGVKTK